MLLDPPPHDHNALNGTAHIHLPKEPWGLTGKWERVLGY